MISIKGVKQSQEMVLENDNWLRQKKEKEKWEDGYREETGTRNKEIECKPKTMKKYTKKSGRRRRKEEAERQSNRDSNKVCKIMQLTARPDYFA